ncbi:MAG: signal peptidase II [Candidatus Cloacimonetes bacterium]|nr:signal peptidase II [Candidatus Cloacimonadota bacterium]
MNHIEENTIQETTRDARIVVGNITFFWISFFIIFLDQLTKYLVRANISYGDIIKLTPKFFWLTHVRNTGAAFSFSFGSAELNRIIFLIVSSLASLLLVYLILSSRNKVDTIAYSLILGGAVGNLIDRIIYGYVTDFIWTDFPDFIMNRWPVFNIADSSIVVAICLLIIFSVFSNKAKESA